MYCVDVALVFNVVVSVGVVKSSVVVVESIGVVESSVVIVEISGDPDSDEDDSDNSDSEEDDSGENDSDEDDLDFSISIGEVESSALVVVSNISNVVVPGSFTESIMNTLFPVPAASLVTEALRSRSLERARSALSPLEPV